MTGIADIALTGGVVAVIVSAGNAVVLADPTLKVGVCAVISVGDEGASLFLNAPDRGGLPLRVDLGSSTLGLVARELCV